MANSRDLPAVGTISYNGFTFPSAVQSRLQCIQVPGSAGNTTKYNQYTFTIECAIVRDDPFTDPDTGDVVIGIADDPVDMNLESLRRRLSCAGKAFRFISQGLGTDLIVNDIDDAESLWDVNFGPKPRIISWEPMGSNRTVRVIWLVEVCLAECTDGVPDPADPSGPSVFPFLDYSYDTSFDIEDGYTVRTIRGTLEIAGTSHLDGGTSTRGVSDAYWDHVFNRFPVPIGFKRKTSRTISRDGRTMEFVIVDTELPSEFPLFAGMLNIEADFSTSSRLMDDGFYRWTADFSASFKLAPNVRRHVAWNAFLILFNSRYSRAFAAPVLGRKKQVLVKAKKPIPLEIELTESLYSREYSFKVTWWFFADIFDLFRFSGMFGDLSSPLSGGVNPDWPTWMNDMRVFGPHNARGWANMGLATSDITKNNACSLTTQGAGYTNNLSAQQTVFAFFPLYNDQPPSSQESWLHGTFEWEVGQTTNISVTSPQEQTPSSDAQPNPALNDNNATSGTKLNQTQTNSVTESLVQVRGPATVSATLRGSLTRMLYPVTIPKIVSIGGEPVYQQGLRTKTMVIPGKFPIYVTAFEIDYLLTRIPTGDVVFDMVTDADAERYV